MPINPIVAAAGIGAGASLLGGGRGRRTSAAVPGDLAGLRQQQINFLQNPQSFLQQFGQFGSPQTGLQRQAGTGIEQFLAQPSPESRTFEFARPILEGMLTGTGPQFERDISLANQQGGRFGSANAILRGEALRNLFNQRTQTAGTLGLLAGQAGQADFGRLLQGFGVGQAQAGQADIETQRRLQLLQGLFGTAQQATLGLPLQQRPNFFEQLGGTGFGIAQLLALLGGQGGGTPTQTAPTGGVPGGPMGF